MRFYRWTSRSLIVLALAALVIKTRADFGDYADEVSECPVMTTCPVVCTNSTFDCLDQCEVGLTLCVDGSCRDSCPDGLTNSCPSCAPIACAKTILDYEDCKTRYADLYEKQDACIIATQDKGRKFSDDPMLIFCLWVTVVTVSTFLWTRVANRSSSVEGDATSKFLDEAKGQTVTGYQSSTLGEILYGAVIATLVCFQLMIMVLCILSYRDNEEEALFLYEIIWTIGFFWTFLFKWPYSVRSVFYQRCPLSSAENVCVFSPSTTPESLIAIRQQAQVEKQKIRQENSQQLPTYIVIMQLIIYKTGSMANNFMAMLFNMPPRGAGKVEYIPVRTDESIGTKYFVYHFRRYNYDEQSENFLPGSMKVAETIGDVVDSQAGLSSQEVQRRLRIVGPNTIEMKKPSPLGCVVAEFSKPFYCYQLYLLWTWVPLYYYYMAIIHGSCVITGGLASSFFRYRNECNLFKLSHISGEITCKRDGQLVTVQQANLVPGDLVNVNDGLVYSDMVLVSTEGILLDESALTGESTPMAKTAVDPSDRNRFYSPVTDKKHTILAGTTVIESEVDSNMAVVLTTGSFTSKGELLREIFQYERASFEFDAEVPFVLLILFVQAIFYVIFIVFTIREQPVYAWFYCLYCISNLLPPLLPTVFTVSVGISDNRLSEKRIACSNSEEILVAGKVSKAFFDKTGTLTRQGLDFISAKCRKSWDSDELSSGGELSPDMIMGMSCCHHLTQTSRGEIIGNPVDRTMFQSSGATLVHNPGSIDQVLDKNGNSLDLLKHFDFDHHRMTQSVIVKQRDGSLMCFVKGSGESIEKLCSPDTLPANFAEVVRSSAKSGTYQISMAMKKLEAINDLSTISRDDVERDLTFVGVINFKNVLRDETPEVIQHLESGGVQCIMVTGDSVLTGITIAKECGMIKEGVEVLLCSSVESDGSLTWVNEATEEIVDLPARNQLRLGSSVELAVTGEVWAHLLENDPADAASLAPAIRIYGRCTPFTKVSAISSFVEMGFVTLMCGDGGNDCGALKTAHVGVALSDAEASIVSPFTSLDKTISSVVEILKEGRCALASALASYKYIIIYGQVEAMNNTIMAFYRIMLVDYAWAFMDGFWMIGMGFTLPLAQAAGFLSPSRPTSSLLGFHTVASTVGVLFINFFFTGISLFILSEAEWFQCRKWDRSDISNLSVIGDNYESSVVFVVSGYQFISSAMAYNFGYEFRQGWFKNTYFVCLVAFFTFLHYWATLVPGTLSCFWSLNCDNDHVVYSVIRGEKEPIQNPYNTTMMPLDFRLTLVVLITLNAALNMAWDYYVVNGIRKRAEARKQQKQLQLKGGGKTEMGDII